MMLTMFHPFEKNLVHSMLIPFFCGALKNKKITDCLCLFVIYT